jgi:hypothetical protein
MIRPARARAAGRPRAPRFAMTKRANQRSLPQGGIPPSRMRRRHSPFRPGQSPMAKRSQLGLPRHRLVSGVPAPGAARFSFRTISRRSWNHEPCSGTPQRIGADWLRSVKQAPFDYESAPQASAACFTRRRKEPREAPTGGRRRETANNMARSRPALRRAAAAAAPAPEHRAYQAGYGWDSRHQTRARRPNGERYGAAAAGERERCKSPRA